MDNCASQETMNLALGALTGILVVLQQIFSYYRHKHIMSDNQRLLRVVEDPTYVEQRQK